MHEKVVIPPAEELKIVERNWYTGPKEDFRPYRFDGKGVAPMVKAGDGYRFHTTGLTHDERGYPDLTPEMNKKLVTHLIEKIESNAEDIIRVEEDGIHGAEVVVLSYGIASASPFAPSSRRARRHQGRRATARHCVAVLRAAYPRDRPQGESHRGA